jgi:spore coat polysaccharide biosynthesis protein SpsF (cytidylyltransferase family)
VELDDGQYGIIVFSRMNSKRLPGKALMSIAGMPLLERVIRRAKLTGYKVVLATSDSKEDDALENLAQLLNVNCFRGSEHNVLSRAIEAAKHNNFEVFARLCGDRPLFSIKELKYAMQQCLAFSDKERPDLITNHIPKKPVRGLTTEIVKTSCLESIAKKTVSPNYTEHITMGIYENTKQFTICGLKPIYKKWTKHTGFAVDQKDDLVVISKILSENPELDFELELNDHPELHHLS